jgi:6-phosphogluconolactonase
LDKLLNIFSTPYELAEKFAEEFAGKVTESAKFNKRISVALSGGTTPELLFSLLGDHFSKSIPWEYVHFFWGDERCVPPDDKESNYGMTHRRLFEKIDIPASNIHRIRGEDNPGEEASRYSEELADFLNSRDGMPLFDLIILGLGEDGHTASIFPGHKELFSSDKICEVTVHPVTLNKRITITGKVINNADSVAFLVTGKKKAEIIEKIIKKSGMAQNFPASSVVPVYGILSWYLDRDAAMLI